MSRFRKGKKAYKLGRKGALYNKYLSHLESIQRKRIVAIKLSQAAVIQASSAFRIAAIQMQHFAHPALKALAVIREVVNAAQGVQKVMINL